MKKIAFWVFIIFILMTVTLIAAPLQHTWEEVDQAVSDVQDAIPFPSGKLVPDGGTTGQILGKHSNTDGDTEWTNQKWYAQLEIPDLTRSYIFMRPFYDWKFSNLIGRTDAGTVDVDVQLCDADNTCYSFLSSVVTINTSETAIPFSSDGITADHYVKVVPSNVQGGATRMNLYSAGTYETGTPPTSNCDPATDLVGYNTIGSNSVNNTIGAVRFTLYEPSCDGEVHEVFFYGRASASGNANVRVLFYLDDGDNQTDSGDTYVTSVQVTVNSTSNAWHSVTLDDGTLDSTKKYWVGLVTGNGDTGFVLYYDNGTNGTDYSSLSSGVASWYDNPPAQLFSMTMESTPHKYSIYGSLH